MYMSPRAFMGNKNRSERDGSGGGLAKCNIESPRGDSSARTTSVCLVTSEPIVKAARGRKMYTVGARGTTLYISTNKLYQKQLPLTAKTRESMESENFAEGTRLYSRRAVEGLFLIRSCLRRKR